MARCRARALGARVAGTEAAVAIHEKLLLGSTAEVVVQRVAQGRERTDLFDELKRAFRDVPPRERERERRRRAARLEQSRLEATHPPTGARIRLLEERPRVAGTVVLDEARSAQIDRELEPLFAVAQQRLIDEHRDRLYRS